MSVSPTAWDFGNVGVSGAVKTVTLTNNGSAPLSVSNVSITGQFSQTNTCSAPLAVSASCTFTVNFLPTTTGPAAGTLTINDNATGSPHTVTLSGNGQIPIVTLAPTSLTFSATPVGQTSAAQTVVLTNTGNVDLTITGITMPGVNTGDFAQTNTCGPLPATVLAGRNCAFSVTFKPTAEGTRLAFVTIDDDASNTPQSIALSGTGVLAPIVGLSPTILAFGSQGATGPSQTVTLANNGSAPLTISGVGITGQFSISSNTCVAPVAAGGNCAIDVKFAPTTPGTASGTLTITDNAAGSPHTVTLSGNGQIPIVTLAPTSLTFSATPVGQTSAAQTVVLTNTGNVDLTIAGITMTGVNTGDFAQTNTCGPLPATVLAGRNCAFSVTFKPTAAGTRLAFVSITDNAPGSPQTIGLTGTGLAAPAVTLAPTSLTFASQPVTTPPIPSSPQTVVLTNTGTATLNFTGSGITISGVNASNFAQTNTCLLPVPSLAAGASCAISVTFTPSAAGTRLAAVTISDDAGNSPQSIALTGTGVIAPAVTLSTHNLTFPDTPVGTTSASQPVTLTNSGSADLEISSIVMTGDFAKSDHCLTTMPPGTSCIIDVTFKPTAVGNRYGAMTINDNAGDSPQTVLLSGNGLAAPSVSLVPAALTFGDQTVNTTSGVQTVTLTNTGAAPLTIASISVGLPGANASDFAQTNNCPPSLAAGATCTISATFRPTAAGMRAASISIVDDAQDSPQIVSMSGNGTLPPGVGLVPTSLTFAEQAIGTTSDPQTVTLTNTGAGTLNFLGSPFITITGPNPSDFIVSNTCLSTLAPGLTCTITVTFRPTASGNRLAAVSIADNAPGSPQGVPLFGGGSTVAGDYTLSVDPTAVSIFAGSTANVALTLTSVAGFTGNVKLSCTGAPRQAVCVVNPATATPPATVAVSIQTTARVQAPPGSSPILPPSMTGLRWLSWAFALVMMATILAARRRRALLVFGVLMLFALLWTACGGGGQYGVPNGTPAGTYTLTITGVSGSSSKTTTVTLTVN